MGRSVCGTKAFVQFAVAQNMISFADLPLAMDPLWLNRVKPGTFGGQQASQDEHTLASLLDRLIVGALPSANHLTLVPGGVVPDQDENRDRL